MKWSGELTRSVIKKKRAKVSPEKRDAKKILRARSDGVCEGCGRNPASDFSHRVKASQGGSYCPTNGLDLCRPCHTWLHDNETEAEKLGWLLRSHQDPADVPAWLFGRGLVFLRADGSIEEAPEEAA